MTTWPAASTPCPCKTDLATAFSNRSIFLTIRHLFATMKTLDGCATSAVLLRCEVAGDVEDQLRQSVGKGVNLARRTRRHDCHVVGNGTIGCIQRRDDRLLLAVRPQRSISEGRPQ